MSHVRQVLLGADEPPPFSAIAGAKDSPYLIISDHAGRRIPRVLGTLGLAEHELERHIAWDIGAAPLGEYLASELEACLIQQNYSRLVIDCNRPLNHPDSIVEQSEDTIVPGNLAISAEQAQVRAHAIFSPYHDRIRRELAERSARAQPSILIFLHTFTPRFKGVVRTLHAGVLYNKDTRLALPLLHGLRREPGLLVGDNEPYAASDSTDFGLIEHGERRGLPCVELEVRQDLLADAEGQSLWAKRLARHLRAIKIDAN